MPLPPFLVHTAAAPADDYRQRCVVCGLVLQDNAGWAAGEVAVMAGDDRGPSWWPVAALIGSDKEPGGRGGMTYQRPPGRLLDADERPCAMTVAAGAGRS